MVVSHDRCFMDKTVDTLLVLDGQGGISGFVGTCSEYLQLLAQEEKAPKDHPAKATASTPASEPQQATNSGPEAATRQSTTPQPRRRTYKEQQEWLSLEESIMIQEERKTELEALLSGGESDFSRLGVLTEEYNQLTQSLDTAYLRWEELAELKDY